MNEIKKGDKLQIHCYKHNEKLHRQWDEAIVLDIKDDYIVFGNNRTTVIDSDGKVWKTKEPAIMFFYKKRWFNIIGQLKDYGIYFYCNIASPFLIDDRVIKYIDYDLDLRVFPNGSFKILDRMEYKFHKKQMNYSNRLDFILKYELGNLIDMVRLKEGPFDKKTIEEYHKEYEKLTTNQKKDNQEKSGHIKEKKKKAKKVLTEETKIGYIGDVSKKEAKERKIRTLKKVQKSSKKAGHNISKSDILRMPLKKKAGEQK